MRANSEKFQFTILLQKPFISNFKIDESEVEILGLTIDKELNFSTHVDKLCRDAQYKSHALRRIKKYLTSEKVKMLSNAFIDCQLNYAPLMWMFCRKAV